MRWLINYIRSLFCKHEWEFLRKVEFYEDCNTMPSKHLIMYCCKKCGYVQKIRY